MKKDSKEVNCVQILIDALNFYSNPDNYWNTPLDLEENYDRRTLTACHNSKKDNKVLMDRGKIAWDAIKKFDAALKKLKKEE